MFQPRRPNLADIDIEKSSVPDTYATNFTNNRVSVFTDIVIHDGLSTPMSYEDSFWSLGLLGCLLIQVASFEGIVIADYMSGTWFKVLLFVTVGMVTGYWFVRKLTILVAQKRPLQPQWVMANI